MDDEERLAKLRRLKELRELAAAADASPAITPTPGLPTPPQSGPDASTPYGGVSTKGYRFGALDQTLKQMGEEASPLSKIGLGALESGARTARAFGLPQSLRAMGVDLDPQGDTALDKVGKGTGFLGGVGDLAGTLTQAVPLGARMAAMGAKMMPARVTAFLEANPRLAAYLGASTGAAGTTAVMTPGDVGERGTQAMYAAGLALPLTAAARNISKPVELSDIGQQIKAATGETPPVHIGAESKMLRDIGSLEKNLPMVGSRLQEGERRVFDAGVKQLWSHATPPGMPSLVEHASEVKRGPIFSQLEDQFDQAYSSLLKGQRIPTTNADRTAITNLVDRELVPADAAKVHKILGDYFPKGNFMGGESWKELQGIIRSKASKFNASDDEATQLVGQTLDKVEGYLVKMRNKALPKDISRQLDATDQAHSVRQLLEDAISSKGGEKGLTPEMLSNALRSRTTDATIAKGGGVGQPLIDPLSATLGSMAEKSLPSAMWGAAKVAGLGVAGSQAGTAAPLMTLPILAPWLGASRTGAKAAFGEFEMQKALAEAMRNHPTRLPSGAAALELQSQE